MAGRRGTRPPPEGGAPGRTRLGFLRRRRGETRGLRAATDAAYERSDAAEQERVIVEALTDLRDMDVREVMTPRMDVVALTIPVSAEDVARAVRESGHSCYPVVNGGLDDLVGVLYVNDLFRSRRSGRGDLFAADGRPQPQEELPLAAGPDGVPAAGGSGAPHGTRVSLAKTREARESTGLPPVEISRRVRQAYVIPESRPILAALVEMRRHRRGFAVVVDEYGGVAGVLTVKDLLEPIVGELHDELDVDEGPSMVRVDGSRWLVDGRTNVDDVRERLGIDVPEGEYVTLGGFLLDVLGHIPAEGERTRIDGWDLTVHEMEKRRIASVLLRRRDGTETRPAAAPDADVVDEAPQGAGDHQDRSEPEGPPAAPARPGAGPAGGTPRPLQ